MLFYLRDIEMRFLSKRQVKELVLLVLTAPHCTSGEGRPVPPSGYSWARTALIGLRVKCWSGLNERLGRHESATGPVRTDAYL